MKKFVKVIVSAVAAVGIIGVAGSPIQRIKQHISMNPLKRR